MGKLTINDIAAVLVDKNGLDRREANQFVTELFAVIMERLNAGEQVKVRGLGTFRIIDVEPRESVSVRTGERVTISGHSKLTFTPDATMKELVNKPFSQFETVVLNDGVEFDDMKVVTKEDPKDDEPEEEPEEVVREEVPEEVVREEVPVVAAIADVPTIEETIADVSTTVESVIEEVLAEEPLIEVAEEEAPVEEAKEEVPVEEVKEDAPVEEVRVPFEMVNKKEELREENNKKRPLVWLLKMFGVLALMAVSAYGGYYYGVNKPLPDVVPDTIVVRDTVVVDKDSVKVSVEKTEPEEVVTKDTVKAVTETAQVTAKVVEKKVEKKVEESVDKYASKDDRVRLGAYRIVGLDHEVKVQAGQTFYGICRANLGPDMECYVEVYNNLPKNPTIKEGQVIKIPKLQLKKRNKK